MQNISIKKLTYLLSLLLIPVALISGLHGGLLRLDISVHWLPQAAAFHALLLIGGFLGSLITLERSFNSNWRWLSALNAFSIPLLLINQPIYAVGINAISGALLSMQLSTHYRQHGTVVQLWMATASLLWLGGSLIYLLGGNVAAAVPWWIAFLLITIVAERLELSKFLPTPKTAKNWLNSLLSVYVFSLLLPFHSLSSMLQAVLAILIAGWLLRYDMARRSIRRPGQFRYIGIGLMTGYLWLGCFGTSILLSNGFEGFYEFILHSFFLGFVFSMIWAHAPVLLPSILGYKVQLYYSPLIAAWLLFQISLIGRLYAIVAEQDQLRRWMGLMNASALFLFFLTIALTMVVSRQRKQACK